MNFDILDDDEEALRDEIEDQSPYNSISAERLSNPQNKIKEMILSRRAPKEPQQEAVSDYSPETMAKWYNEGQEELSELRDRQRDSNLITNLGSAFSDVARGTNAPVSDSSFYDRIGKQQTSEIASKEKDLDRRQRIINAILRKSQTKEKDNTREINSARGTFKHPVIEKEMTKLNASRGAQSLIEAIRSGHLIGSKTVAKQLTNMIATIEFGGPGAEADRRAMGVDSLYSSLQDLRSWMTSHPNEVIPEDYLNQIETEVYALGDRAAQNYHNLTKSRLQGTDASLGNANKEKGLIYDLSKRERDSFLKENGYNPLTGQSLRKPKGEFKNKHEMVKIRGPKDPEGSFRWIPIEKLDEALKANAVRVN